MIVFDIETNGLLDELTTIHCIAWKDTDTGDVVSHGPDSILVGLNALARKPAIGGHNVIDFDIPAIQKVYPSWKPGGVVRDTLVMSRLIYADLRDRDFTLASRDEEFPRRFIGSHSLKAWGYRLDNLKDDYDGGWETWSQEMHDYCIQDVQVTAHLWDKLTSKGFSEESIELEHRVAAIIKEQERYGFRFDVGRAHKLYSELLGRRLDLVDQLQRAVPPWTVRTPFTPKRDNKTRGYKAGVTIYKEHEVEFNPNSRDHIAKVLKGKGWEPKEFTPEGKPKVDETILSKLSFPEAKLLAENFMLTKRLGQIGEGKQSWLHLERDGRLHGRVNTNGAVTGRMTHSHPNMAQVPSVRKPFGTECRSLFTTDPGYLLVGCDADALELRCLAGYMAAYDNGDYIDVILKGDKDSGTDMHSINANILGCNRDTAKTFFYAFIYGAGVSKLGSVLGGSAQTGKLKRDALLNGVPALGALARDVKHRAKQRGYLKGLDGRLLAVRSDHAALNTLLQAAGAILMKKALVLLHEDLKDYDAHFVANVHDEWQIQAREEDAEEVGRRAVDAIRRAGPVFGFRCPLDANYCIGRTWADTH